MQLTSQSFKDGKRLPVKYTIDGEKLSPPLKWMNLPMGTKSFALLMDDLDVPKEFGGIFIHWMVYDIPANVGGLAEGAGSPGGKLPAGAKEVPNFYAQFGIPDFIRYGPPWPPTPDHRYRFTLYALNVEKLALPANVGYPEFKKAVEEAKIFSAELIGIYGPAKTPLPKQ